MTNSPAAPIPETTPAAEDGAATTVRSRWLVGLLLACGIILIVWVRFEGITHQGMGHQSDGYEYLYEARIWASGQPARFIDGRIYRPAAFWLHGMALRVFGFEDYSIKILHAGLDLVNIALIFAVMRLLYSDLLLSLTAVLLYAFLPRIVEYARNEMIQTPSMTFILMALYSFALHERIDGAGRMRKTGSLLLLGASGVASGLAANVHPELAMAAPGYVLYLFIRALLPRPDRKTLRLFVLKSLLFSVGFFLPYGLGMAVFGFSRVIHVLFAAAPVMGSTMGAELNEKLSVGAATAVLELPSRLLTGLHRLNYAFLPYFLKTRAIMAVLFLSSPLVMIFLRSKGRRDPALAYLPLILILTYNFSANLVLQIYPDLYARIFMPFIPMTIIVVVYWYSKLLEQTFGNRGRWAFYSLALLLFLIHPTILPGQRDWSTMYRSVYDTLEDKVDRKHRLLVAPLIAYQTKAFERYREGFRNDLYFGPRDVVYQSEIPISANWEYTAENLDRILNTKNVGYVFIGDRVSPHWLERGGRFKSWLNNRKFDYDLERDRDILNQYLALNKGRLFAETPFGPVYEIEQESPADLPRSPLPPGERELVIGGDMESEDPNRGLGAISSEFVRSGRSSWKIETTAPYRGIAYQLRSPGRYREGQQFAVSCWVYTEDPDMRVMVAIRSLFPMERLRQDRPLKRGEWTRFEFVREARWTNLNRGFRVEVSTAPGSAAGVIYVDDLSVK